MKIVLLIRSLNYGGAERQLILLAKGLRERGHQVSVAVFYQALTGQKALENELSQSGIEQVCLNKRGRYDLVEFFVRLLLFLKRKKPDVLYSYMGGSNLFAGLTGWLTGRKLARRIVIGIRASELNYSDYGCAARVERCLEILFSRGADALISNSEAGLQAVRNDGISIPDMRVVPNGVNCELFFPDSEARKRERVNLGLGSDEVLVGTLARLDPMKGHEQFFQAAKLVSERLPAAKFLCVGGGSREYETKLRRIASELLPPKKLIWVDRRSDIRSVINALDILVSSSIYGEGFSNVIAEAMACAVPCVVTNAGDSAKIVADCGIVVGRGKIQELADAICWLALHDRSSLGQRACERVRANFDVQSMIQKTEEVLCLKA